MRYYTFLYSVKAVTINTGYSKKKKKTTDNLLLNRRTRTSPSKRPAAISSVPVAIETINIWPIFIIYRCETQRHSYYFQYTILLRTCFFFARPVQKRANVAFPPFLYSYRNGRKSLKTNDIFNAALRLTRFGVRSRRRFVASRNVDWFFFFSSPLLLIRPRNFFFSKIITFFHADRRSLIRSRRKPPRARQIRNQQVFRRNRKMNQLKKKRTFNIGLDDKITTRLYIGLKTCVGRVVYSVEEITETGIIVLTTRT